jgi:hypothetical protein
MNPDEEGICKKVVVAYFHVLTQHFIGGTDKSLKIQGRLSSHMVNQFPSVLFKPALTEQQQQLHVKKKSCHCD